MPRFKKVIGEERYYVRTAIAGHVITYQLTKDGAQELLGIGLRDDSIFGRALLLSLIHSNDAFTHGTGIQPGPENQGQMELDFKDDPYHEEDLPTCSNCSSAENLYLVTIAPNAEDKPDAYLLCPACRASLQTDKNVSIPISLVSREAYLKLKQWNLVQNPESRVTMYSKALNTNYE